eukprot:TRINITY_DN1930_c0_g1_i1.p1 TRINITY_DN1930_c0_g1~~TRINITY_DN1930_c0_g1_i1.p1  ORF type:complete len:176 (-),score=30.66 TRINITY_DN1930_c0_g1_i1:18-545(-)
MQSFGLIKNAQDVEKVNQLGVLKEPVKISDTAPIETVDDSKATKNRLNTYEVVNIDLPPVDDEWAEACVSIEKFIEFTKVEDPILRKKALRELCPCHVKRDVKEFWDRIIEMTNDPDPGVRYQVLHNLCDGSPATREDDVIKAIETMHNDEDKYIRRRVHQILAHYRKTGKWNIL